MRIFPIKKYNVSVINTNNNTQFESKNNQNIQNKSHNYTGCPSVDLAYASMFDEAIAKDLKLMGLI